MYVEKEISENWIVLGSCCIPLVSTAQIIEKSRYSHKIVGTYIKDVAGVENYYTFLIGDNGIGKTSLLDSIYGGNIFRMESGMTKNKKEIEINRLFIGPSVGNKNYDVKDGRTSVRINSNTVDIRNLFLFHVFGHVKELESLERILRIEFSRNLEIVTISGSGKSKGGNGYNLTINHSHFFDDTIATLFSSDVNTLSGLLECLSDKMKQNVKESKNYQRFIEIVNENESYFSTSNFFTQLCILGNFLKKKSVIDGKNTYKLTTQEFDTFQQLQVKIGV